MENIHWQAYLAKKIRTPQTIIQSRTIVLVFHLQHLLFLVEAASQDAFYHKKGQPRQGKGK
eukprot:11083785-Prorocentrum_lima.AAC.1